MFIKIRTDVGIILLPICTIFDIKSIEDHKKHFKNVRNYDEENYQYIMIRKDLPTSNDNRLQDYHRELLITEDTLSEIIKLFSYRDLYNNLLTDDKKYVSEENK